MVASGHLGMMALSCVTLASVGPSYYLFGPQQIHRWFIRPSTPESLSTSGVMQVYCIADCGSNLSTRWSSEAAWQICSGRPPRQLCHRLCSDGCKYFHCTICHRTCTCCSVVEEVMVLISDLQHYPF